MEMLPMLISEFLMVSLKLTIPIYSSKAKIKDLSLLVEALPLGQINLDFTGQEITLQTLCF